MTPICHSTPSMYWQRWPSFNRIKKTAPIIGAVWSVSHFNAPNEPEHDRRLGHNTHDYGPQHFLLVWKRASTSILGLVCRRNIWIEWTQKSLSYSKPIFHTAAFTATKEKTEHGDVFSSKGRSVAAHLRGMRPAPSTKKDTLMLRGKLKL